MQVVQAVCGTFHHFDLARELDRMGHLKRIYSSFPWLRLEREGVPRGRVRTFPWIHGPLMASRRYIQIPHRISKEIELTNLSIFDAWVAHQMEECDAFVCLSSTGLKAGRVAQRGGSKYVCDRGSSHIRFQRAILDEEYSRWGFRGEQVDARSLEHEEAEYAQADAITVASEFSRRTFVEMGVSEGKLKRIPLGVRLDRFTNLGEPPSDHFNVLFAGTVSVRKGIPYLLDAFAKLRHPLKRLRMAGPVEREMSSLLKRFDMTHIEMLGPLPQTELAKWMNMSHALVLPSVEDGFGLVMAQAMACGAVVIASENTGGPDLFTDHVEGFVVPIRSGEAICERLTQLADDRDLQRRMGAAAVARVQGMGGWRDYGTQYAEFLKELTGEFRAKNPMIDQTQ